MKEISVQLVKRSADNEIIFSGRNSKTIYVQGVIDGIESFFDQNNVSPNERGRLFSCQDVPFPDLTEYLKNQGKIGADSYVGISGTVGAHTLADPNMYQTFIQDGYSNSIDFLEQRHFDKYQRNNVVSQVFSSDLVSSIFNILLNMSIAAEDVRIIDALEKGVSRSNSSLLVNWNQFGVVDGFYREGKSSYRIEKSG